ncbi:MAG TPA: ImmA/IrrE family metallo-endopeptidase [Ktedonobacteraceae bacterium]|nr:ImmA/IrrE family metallo-endopeptidase [Ktedonobacteraceae bacterium]
MNMFSREEQRDLLRTRIEQLYQETGVKPSTERKGSYITPLGDLIGSFNLVNKELVGLTLRTALCYLSQQGALNEPTEGTSNEALAGFLYTNTSYGCIFVEARDLFVRRRFSAAHELGHFLLHFQPLLLMAEKDDEYLELTEIYHGKTDDPEATESGSVERVEQHSLQRRLPFEARMEYEANQFATELLMPEETVRQLCARVVSRLSDDDLVGYMAREMLVSLEAMRWRLRNLGLLPLPGHSFQRDGERQ